MTDQRRTETVTFHFDLNHVSKLGADKEFTFRGDGKGRTLVVHTDESRRAHAQQNLALASMPAEHLGRLSHYCEDVEVPSDAVAWRWIGYRSTDPNALSDDVALVFQHVSNDFARRVADELRQQHGGAVRTMLHDYGVEAPDDDTHTNVHVAALSVKTPIEIALTIIMQHPDVAQLVPSTHQYVRHQLAQLTSITALWKYISTHMSQDGPQDVWYEKIVCTNPNSNPGPGAPLPAGPLRPADGLKDKDGKLIDWSTDESGRPVIVHFKLSDGVAAAAKPVIQDAVRLLKADPNMKGRNWTKQHGVTVKERTGGHDVVAAREVLAVASEPQAEWTIKNTTSQYGLDLYPETLSYDNSRLSFEVKNWPNRGLGVSWQARDPEGKPLDTPKYLEMIGSGNVIFGIPIWTENAEIEIMVPSTAAQVDVLLGGIGNGYQQMDVDWQGIVYTSMVSYGVPSFLSVLSVGAATCKPFVEALGGLLDVLIPLGQEVLQPVLTGTGEYDLGYSLSLAAESAAGVLLSKQLEVFALKITAYATAEEIMENIPFVGWVLRVASIASAVADMIATSIEVGLSPMTYVLEAKRSMTLRVVVNPDPTHGTDTQKPIWPEEANHWMITVQYRGGTALRKAGAMPARADTPIEVLFSKATNDELPSAPGEQFQIVAVLFSETDWIAGKWVSGWIDAVPDEGSGRTESGSIIEQLVPLMASTIYRQVKKLNYDGASSSYVWQGITFALDDTLESSLIAGPAPAEVLDAFWGKGVRLSADTTITDVAPGQWTVDDTTNGVTYDVLKQPIQHTDQSLLEVRNHTHPAPSGTAADLSDQNVSELVDITLHDLAYKLGYCYNANSQDLPLDYGPPTNPKNDTMYVLESISTLANPGAGMKTPGRGFTSKPYIAYDHFGPSALFTLEPAENYQPGLDRFTSAGPVPDDLRLAFQASGHQVLVADATLVVVTASASWRIAASGKPLFDLRRQTDVILVFNAPVPEFSPRNFYLDTRTYATEKIRHLRLIDLQDESGPTFDYDSTLSWGAFDMPDLDAIAVHPNGFVIGISYNQDQMAVLRLPDSATADDQAPHALPMTGTGVREGLMQGPIGMTITADGRILVLEKTGARIQAFDTFGNPAQCFAAELEFDLPTDFVDDLNDGTASLRLLHALQQAVPVRNPAPDAFDKRYLLMPVVTLDSSFASVLDGGTVTDELRSEFDTAGLDLGSLRRFTPPQRTSSRRLFDETVHADVTIETTKQGSLWIIADQSIGLTYDARLNGNQIEVFRGMTPIISVKAPSAEWIIRDKTNTLTFEVKQQKMSSGQSMLHVVRLQACMRLKTGTSPSIVYLDVAVESKGFIYVLVRETPLVGPLTPGDYRLDIYNPDGTPLSQDPQANNGNVNAERITVDQWRTLFSLNYEQMFGRAGRPEPTVSQWIPSTPAGT